MGPWHKASTHGEQHFDHVKHHTTDSHVHELRHLRARTAVGTLRAAHFCKPTRTVCLGTALGSRTSRASTQTSANCCNARVLCRPTVWAARSGCAKPSCDTWPAQREACGAASARHAAARKPARRATPVHSPGSTTPPKRPATPSVHRRCRQTPRRLARPSLHSSACWGRVHTHGRARVAPCGRLCCWRSRWPPGAQRHPVRHATHCGSRSHQHCQACRS